MSEMPNAFRLLVGPFLLASLGVSTTSGQERERNTAVRAGIVITVEGIGGIDKLNPSVAAAVRKAGLPHEVRRFAWTHGLGHHLTDLQDTQHLLRKADELADLLKQLRSDDPERPLYVVAKSCGTGLALFALAEVPAKTVDRVILISAAVAPSFDLRPALRASRGGIVAFHSRNDQLILNWGTSRFGTADRYYGASAGLYGFVVPTDLDAADRALYRQLVQVAWTPHMLLHGYPGTHVGTSMPGFLVAEITPWLR